MGRNLHVATTYNVEWSDTSAFSHRPYEFRLLLNELDIPVSSMSSADDDDYLDFEVRRDDWKSAIRRLESIAFMTEPRRVAIKDLLEQLGSTSTAAVNTFKRLLEIAEPEGEWLHFSFF